MVWTEPSTKAGTFYDFEANIGGGALVFLEHEGAMDRNEALAWLRERGLISISIPSSRESSIGGNPERARLRPSPPATGNGDELLPYEQRLWQQSEPVPMRPDHPARRWLEARYLWRPDCPLPKAVRWLCGGPRHEGAGSIIAALAPLSQWQDSWPRVPVPVAVHVVAIDAEGRPSLDRPKAYGGRGKRIYGQARTTVLLIGNPCLHESIGPVRLCEGLADALALASRFEGPVFGSIGTPSRLARDTHLVDFLAGASCGVVIHADNDLSGVGIQAGATLRQAVRTAGGQVRLVRVQDGKDPADQATASRFHPLDIAWISYAQTLREMYAEWPRWEVARQATVALGGPIND